MFARWVRSLYGSPNKYPHSRTFRIVCRPPGSPGRVDALFFLRITPILKKRVLSPSPSTRGRHRSVKEQGGVILVRAKRHVVRTFIEHPPRLGECRTEECTSDVKT